MKKWWMIVILAACVTVFGHPHAGAQQGAKLDHIRKSGKITVGTSAEYAPYEFHKKINGKDQIVGFDINIAKEIAKDLGVELVIRDMEFGNLLTELKTGGVDFVIAGMTPDEERRKSVDFSNIYYEAKQAVFVRADDQGKFKTMKDLEGKTLGVQIGTTQETIAKAVPNAKIRALGRTTELVLELKSKKVDALIVELPVAQGYVRNNPDLALSAIQPQSEAGGSAVAVNKGETSLLSAIQTTLDRLTAEGKIDQWVAEMTELAESPDTGTGQAARPAYNWNFTFLKEYGSYFWTGIRLTLEVSAVAVIGGFIFGTLISLLRLSSLWLVQFIGSAYVEIIRGTPMLVQLLLFYYGLPLFAGLDIGLFGAACLTLIVNSSAYIAEIMRAGIQGVDRGQMEAARSLGMPRGMALRLIILPQAFKTVLPALGNEFVVVVKESSILSVIGFGEIIYQANAIRAATYQPLEPLLVAAAIYFVLTFTLSKLLGLGERRLRVSD
ncbi:transporter substrate-binding domain-containing protein [Cohnella pontilimi]|uniref:Transporter substrate-binding domain-containing protein n=1 Tax=Cohnella pontilimi TaxID=2564100 RepID=A0A4U0FD78_9BACL|nr:ABC transporter permease subunit [Cohnella pontilimi]TJY42707.1 transporter substrate-binding domain-containing protein [Cohnella pontilimi]